MIVQLSICMSNVQGTAHIQCFTCFLVFLDMGLMLFVKGCVLNKLYNRDMLSVVIWLSEEIIRRVEMKEFISLPPPMFDLMWFYLTSTHIQIVVYTLLVLVVVLCCVFSLLVLVLCVISPRTRIFLKRKRKMIPWRS